MIKCAIKNCENEVTAILAVKCENIATNSLVTKYELRCSEHQDDE